MPFARPLAAVAALALIALGLAGLPPAHAGPVTGGNLLVSSDGSVSSLSLARGVYDVRAVGTYRFGPQDHMAADAEYDFEGAACRDRGAVLELLMNGADVKWGDCQASSHEYTIKHVCLEPCDVTFHIFDTNYADNQGGIWVTIRAVVAEPTLPTHPTPPNVNLGSAFNVPASGETVTAVLQKGSYNVEATGTYKFGAGADQVADADFSYEEGSYCWDRAGQVLDLLVDERSPWTGYCFDRPPFQTTYTCGATACQLKFRIHDTNYGDNSGALQVNITPR